PNPAAAPVRTASDADARAGSTLITRASTFIVEFLLARRRVARGVFDRVVKEATRVPRPPRTRRSDERGTIAAPGTRACAALGLAGHAWAWTSKRAYDRRRRSLRRRDAGVLRPLRGQARRFRMVRCGIPAWRNSSPSAR